MTLADAGFNIVDIRGKEYSEVLHLQEEFFNKNIDAKLSGAPTTNYLILCEHQPVFTLGKSGKRENILVKDDDLQAEYYQINRGGDVTYHGPGQLTIYPIADLDTLKMGVAEYIFNLEQVIIDSLKIYGLTGERLENAAGVWLRDKGIDRKIAAIGAHVSRRITMHGAAVNVNTDLAWFNKIISCGISDKAVTSMKKELTWEIDFEQYKRDFLKYFSDVFRTNA